MKKKFGFVLSVLALALVLVPAFGYAQVTNQCDTLSQTTTIQTIICEIAVLINTVIPILIALGVVYFIYGVITYVISKDEEAKSRGRNAMIWGLIGLLVIVSIWGLVNILRNSFGIYGTAPIDVVCVPSPGIDC